MSRIKRYVMCYDKPCLHLVDLDYKPTALLTVNDPLNDRLRFETLKEALSYVVTLKDCIIYWRHFEQYYKSTIKYLMNNGYSNKEVKIDTDTHNVDNITKNKLVEWEMSYLVTKDNGVFRLFFKTDKGSVIDVHNLDKLIPLNAVDLRDFSDSYDYVDNVVDAVKCFKEQGMLNYLTIGAASYSKFLKTVKTNKGLIDKYNDRDEFLVDKLFPSLKFKLRSMWADWTVWDYVKYAYSGGLCLCKKPNFLIEQDFTCYDACSMYPSVMHSKSGNYYPVGIPFITKKRPDNLNEYYWFIHLNVRLHLKKDGVDFLKLVTDGNRVMSTNVALVLTCTDYELMLENYDVIYKNTIDYLLFNKEIGLFDDFIDYWYNIKKTATGGLRRIAKLILNNLHGKFGSRIWGDLVGFMLADDNRLSKVTLTTPRKDKYIPIGAAVFSYARRVLIDAIKANDINFFYSDTDSMYVAGEVEGIKLGNELGEWKIEHKSNAGLFVGEKRYIIKERWLDPVDDQWYNYRVVWSGLKEIRQKFLIRGLMFTDTGKKAEDVSERGDTFVFLSQYLTIKKIKDLYDKYPDAKVAELLKIPDPDKEG